MHIKLCIHNLKKNINSLNLLLINGLTKVLHIFEKYDFL